MLICKHADNAIRWKEGERLDHLFEQRCDQLHAASNARPEAVITDDAVFTFRQLDDRANQVARFLLEQGLKSGDRIGLMFDKTVDTYVALLAVLKINAAYVPLDAGFPSERIGFILKDAEVKAIVSLSVFRPKLADFPVRHIYLDAAVGEIDGKATARLADHEKSAAVDQLCYIIYTSGTTGTPKGVAIEHPSICNFVKVAAEVYGIREGDRAYQGMTIAFDFSVEELWVPLIAGAALVPGKPGTSLVGGDLADFLADRHVTYFACVPTLLATIERDLPDVRILLVSGEACPHNLVVRWHRPGRTILNAYGPTEATVTATLTELYPDKPVTIGGPLPTYSIVILDEHEDRAVDNGALGEIGIAGIGLAAGYLNRPDLTEKKFVPDFLDIANNPSKRIYRTGDLGRINDQDEVEFHGRIDTQVKIRGYRIELTEIESVLMQIPQIAQAVVDTYESEPGTVELVAYYSLKQGAAALSPAVISETLRKHVPPYMVPAYIEELPIIPMSSSHKADRKNLPAPKGPRFSAGSANMVAPRNETEAALARALIEVMKIERVSVEDNFFQDLGAHSLLMARFCSEIRKSLKSAVSMRDIYLNPTIAKLASHLGSQADEVSVQVKQQPARTPSDLEYYGCGALQLLYYAAYGLFGVWLLTTGFEWTYAAIDNTAEAYLRIVAYAVASFVALNAIPIAAKWLLIGRWKEEVIPIWSLRYFRFWLVKDLIRSAPMALFVGSPIYNVYLRLLGAKVGRNTVIQSKLLPVCTDLISIGDNTILRKDVVATGYKAQANYIHTGAIRIGDNAFVGEASVLDIDTAMEDNAQLGHASSLQVGQRVAQGKHYHGSPAQETSTDFCKVEAKPCTPLRRTLYSAYQLVGIFAVILPVAILLMYHLFPYLYRITSATLLLHDPVAAFLLLSVEILLVSAALFVGVLAIRLLSIVLVPRFLHLFLREDKTYVLYGVHYLIYRNVSAFSNSAVFNLLFGDSSYIVNYLGWVGYRLNKVVQTGANFGLDQRHDNPFLCDIGSGTMVSDGLTMTNVAMSSTLVQARQGQDRRPQLSRQQHLLSGRRQDRRELPARHQGHGPDRRSGARECGAPGLALLRDPAGGRSRQDVRAGREHPAAAARRQEPLQYPDHGGFPAQQLAVLLRSPAVGVRGHILFSSARRACDLRLWRVRLAVHDPLVRPGRAREPRLQAADPATRVDVRRAFLAPRAALEILRIAVADAVQGHAVQERGLAAPGRASGPQGVRRRLPAPRQDADRDRRLHQPERRLRHSGPLAGGGCFQVRLRQDRKRLLHRQRGIRALRRDHGRQRRARPGLVPDEGRDPRPRHPLARKSRQGASRAGRS